MSSQEGLRTAGGHCHACRVPRFTSSYPFPCQEATEICSPPTQERRQERRQLELQTKGDDGAGSPQVAAAYQVQLRVSPDGSGVQGLGEGGLTTWR